VCHSCICQQNYQQRVQRKDEAFNDFFVSVFTGKACSQAAWICVPNVFVWVREVLSTVEEDFVGDYLIKLDLHRPMNVQETG